MNAFVCFVWLQSIVGGPAPAPGSDGTATATPRANTVRALTVINTGFAVQRTVDSPTRIRGNRVSFVVPEVEHGVDLDGDGFLLPSSQFLHVYDDRHGSSINLGFRPAGLHMQTATQIIAPIDECCGPPDLNGDGDFLDEVLHFYDIPTGTLANTTLAADVVGTKGDLVFARVDEADQGMLDRNGDGDGLDTVVQVLGASRARPVGTPGGPSPPASLFGPGVALTPTKHPMREVSFGTVALVGEAEQGGLDRNGDGDALDNVLTLFDGSTGRATNLGIATIGEPSEDAGRLLVLVSERLQGGMSLNDDADDDDVVAHVYDHATRQITSLGLAALDVKVLGDWMAIAVSEVGEQQDLNRDGDATDFVLFLQEVGTSPATNTGLAIGDLSGAGDTFLFSVVEPWQGATDLNGDGDEGDVVLHSFDTRTGTITNLSTALLYDLKGGDRFVTFLVHEGASNADFNFDGDLDDLVLGIYDAVTDSYFNTQRAATMTNLPPAMHGRFVAGSVSEFGDNQDYNGDGDTTDHVPFVYDGDAGMYLPVPVASNGPFALSEELLAFRVHEVSQASQDLNGDGDKQDFVLHLARLP